MSGFGIEQTASSQELPESMDVGTLDGFLTAIVCGSKTIMPSEWMRWV